MLLVASTYREAESLAAACRSLVGEDEVAYYPAWETLPHERLSPRSDTVGRRLAVLRRVVGNDELPAPKIIVAPVRSVLQPQVKGLGHMAPVRLVVGEDIDLDELAQALVGAAYVRVDMVERRGEFAVRGGIVDIFPPTEEHPVRIDFFGDTIEEIRYFTVADQRSSELTLTEVIASPCRELLLTDEVRQRAFTLSQQHPELIDMLDRIAQGHAVDGMEALSPVLVDGMELLVDVLPSDTHVLVCDPELVRGRAIDLVKTSEEFLHASWAAAAGGGKAPIDLGRVVVPAARRRPGRSARPRSGLVDAVAVQRRSGQRGQPGDPYRRRRDRRLPHRRLQPAASSRGRSPDTPRTPTGARSRPRSPRSAAGWPTTGGWCSPPRARA